MTREYFRFVAVWCFLKCPFPFLVGKYHLTYFLQSMEPQTRYVFQVSTRTSFQLDIKRKPRSALPDFPRTSNNPSAPSEHHLRVNLKSAPFHANDHGRWPICHIPRLRLHLFLLTQGAFNSILCGQVFQLRWMLLPWLFSTSRTNQKHGSVSDRKLVLNNKQAWVCGIPFDLGISLNQQYRNLHSYTLSRDWSLSEVQDLLNAFKAYLEQAACPSDRMKPV